MECFRTNQVHAADGIDSLDQIAEEPATGRPVQWQQPEQPAEWRTLKITPGSIREIERKKLKMEKQDPSKRTFSKEFAEKLAKSIASEGLLYPPIVLENEDGTFQVKAGRHRIYACCKILGWPSVPCVVLEAGDDDLAEQIEIASNLWVNPLTESQSRLAIQRWREIYMANNNEKQKTTRGTDRQRNEFPKHVAAALSVSKTTGTRIANTAQFISPEDRATLESVHVPQTKIDKIAELRDPDAVQTAVKLAGAGQDPDEAVRQGKKVKAEKKQKALKPDSGPVAAVPVNEKPTPVKAADMTDDQWLETHCKRLLDVLPYRNAFRNDAILYRRIAEKIINFRTSTKKALAELKKPGANGSFFSNVFRIVRTSHPMNWLICGGCSGTGHVKDAPSEQCKKCYGGGYQVKYEET